MAAAPTTKPTRGRVIPDEAVIHREYSHQVMSGGKRGALARTARICKVSDQHVANVIKRYEASRNLAQLPEHSLDYEPAPGELEYANVRKAIANEAFLRQLLDEEMPTPAPPVTSTLSATPTPTEAPLLTIEPEPLRVAYDPFANRPPSTEHRNHVIQVYLFALVTIIVTSLVILVAKKSLGLSLTLLPEALVMWWVTSHLRRVVYLCKVVC